MYKEFIMMEPYNMQTETLITIKPEGIDDR